jgi:hypothetical protein
MQARLAVTVIADRGPGCSPFGCSQTVMGVAAWAVVVLALVLVMRAAWQWWKRRG